MALSTQTAKELAEKIRTWLRESRQSTTSPELEQFIVSLENNSNVSDWAGVNFERILPLRIPTSPAMRWMSVIRNVLVFLPIVLTWAALREASTKFSDFIVSSPQTDSNFIVFWQGMEGWSSLPTVALVDVIILAVLIVLSILVGAREESRTFTQRLENLHEGLMVDLERNLSGYRYLSLQDLNSIAAGTLSSLQQSVQIIENAADRFDETALRAHDAIVGAHQTVTTDFEPVVQRLDSTLAGLGMAAGSHQQMVDLVQRVQAGLAQELQVLQTSMSQTVSGISGSLTGTSDSVRSAMNGLATAVQDSLQKVVQHMSDTTSSMVAGAQRQANDIALQLANETTNQLGIVSRGLKDSADNLQLANDNFRQSLASLEFGIQQMHTDMRELIDAVKRGRP